MGELPRPARTTMSMPSAMTTMPASISSVRPARLAREGASNRTVTRSSISPNLEAAATRPARCSPERSRPMDLPLTRISFPRFSGRTVMFSPPLRSLRIQPVWYSTEILGRRGSFPLVRENQRAASKAPCRLRGQQGACAARAAFAACRGFASLKPVARRANEPGKLMDPWVRLARRIYRSGLPTSQAPPTTSPTTR